MTADGTGLFERFWVEIYRPPLTEIRYSEAIRDLTKPFHVAMLLVDFETEVSMNGISDFIGNSSGKFVRETIQALRLCNRHKDADLLDEIHVTALTVGMTYEAISAERKDVPEYTVTSWEQLHGEKWSSALSQIADYSSQIDYAGILEAAVNLVDSNPELFRRGLDEGRV